MEEFYFYAVPVDLQNIIHTHSVPIVACLLFNRTQRSSIKEISRRTALSNLAMPQFLNPTD
jgi:hypothetical protein